MVFNPPMFFDTCIQFHFDRESRMDLIWCLRQIATREEELARKTIFRVGVDGSSGISSPDASLYLLSKCQRWQLRSRNLSKLFSLSSSDLLWRKNWFTIRKRILIILFGNNRDEVFDLLPSSIIVKNNFLWNQVWYIDSDQIE